MNVKNQIRQMDRRKKLITVLGSIIFLSIISMMILETFAIQETERSFEANATVTDDVENMTELGISTDPTLQYGVVPITSTVTKKINIGTNETTLITSTSSGNISEKLEFEKSTLTNEEVQLEYSFQAGEESGNYTGTVDLKIQTPQRTGGAKWLELKHSYLH